MLSLLALIPHNRGCVLVMRALGFAPYAEKLGDSNGHFTELSAV